MDDHSIYRGAIEDSLKINSTKYQLYTSDRLWLF